MSGNFGRTPLSIQDHRSVRLDIGRTGGFDLVCVPGHVCSALVVCGIGMTHAPVQNIKLGQVGDGLTKELV